MDAFMIYAVCCVFLLIAGLLGCWGMHLARSYWEIRELAGEYRSARAREQRERETA